jgi:3-oxoacyl-ACP reductase-like protein
MGSFAQVSALEKEYRESLASFTRYSTIEKSLETLSLPEAEAKELSVVSSILTEYEGALQEFHLAQAEFKRISLELHQAQSELDEFKECPLCGGNLCLH